MHKKKIFLILIFSLFIIYLGNMILNEFQLKKAVKKYENDMIIFLQKNEENIFSIDKITFFSSANASLKVNSNSSFNIQNLTQYTDIAIFLRNNSENGYNMENTLKNVTISNIEYLTKPQERNTPALL